MVHAHVTFQVDPGSAPSPPAWLEEVAALAHILKQVGIISAIEEHVQFARARLRAPTIQWILSSSFSAMRSVENAHSPPFMSVSFPSNRSICSSFAASVSLRVLRCPAFLPLWMNLPLRHFAGSFRSICWRENPFCPLQQACGIDR